MIAALGMYDMGACAPVNDRLWALIRDALRDAGEAAPEALRRGDLAYGAGWVAPDLVLAQTCGFPYRATLHDRVTLVGTPDYAVEGCAAGYYHSVYVARKTDIRQGLAAFDGADFAYNEPMSQSGWAAPQLHAQSLGLWFRPALASGGHQASARAVAEGRADLAALDAVTWALLQREHPALCAPLQVIGKTPSSPGLPLITAKTRDPAPLFAAVAAAIVALSAADRDTLHLRGIRAIPSATYLAVPIPPTPEQVAQPY